MPGLGIAAKTALKQLLGKGLKGIGNKALHAGGTQEEDETDSIENRELKEGEVHPVILAATEAMIQDALSSNREMLDTDISAESGFKPGEVSDQQKKDIMAKVEANPDDKEARDKLLKNIERVEKKGLVSEDAIREATEIWRKADKPKEKNKEDTHTIFTPIDIMGGEPPLASNKQPDDKETALEISQKGRDSTSGGENPTPEESATKLVKEIEEKKETDVSGTQSNSPTSAPKTNASATNVPPVPPDPPQGLGNAVPINLGDKTENTYQPFTTGKYIQGTWTPPPSKLPDIKQAAVGAANQIAKTLGRSAGTIGTGAAKALPLLGQGAKAGGKGIAAGGRKVKGLVQALANRIKAGIASRKAGSGAGGGGKKKPDTADIESMLKSASRQMGGDARKAILGKLTLTLLGGFAGAGGVGKLSRPEFSTNLFNTLGGLVGQGAVDKRRRMALNYEAQLAKGLSAEIEKIRQLGLPQADEHRQIQDEKRRYNDQVARIHRALGIPSTISQEVVSDENQKKIKPCGKAIAAMLRDKELELSDEDWKTFEEADPLEVAQGFLELEGDTDGSELEFLHDISESLGNEWGHDISNAGIYSPETLDGYAKFIKNSVYTYKPEATEIDPSIDPTEEHIGPMAQEIEKVNPAAIIETPEGVKTVDLGRLDLMNAGAIGDLARQNIQQGKAIEALVRKVNEMESA